MSSCNSLNMYLTCVGVTHFSNDREYSFLKSSLPTKVSLGALHSHPLASPVGNCLLLGKAMIYIIQLSSVSNAMHSLLSEEGFNKTCRSIDQYLPFFFVPANLDNTLAHKLSPMGICSNFTFTLVKLSNGDLTRWK